MVKPISPFSVDSTTDVTRFCPLSAVVVWSGKWLGMMVGESAAGKQEFPFLGKK